MLPLECINAGRNRWAVRLDVQADPESGENAVTYVEGTYDHEPTVEDVRALVCQTIEDYDTSDAVNTFTLGDKTMWLDNLNRTSLIEVARSRTAEDEAATVEVWADGECQNVAAKDLVRYLTELITYAKATFDVTQHHKLDVQGIEDVDGLIAFDIRADYPATLNFPLSD